MSDPRTAEASPDLMTLGAAVLGPPPEEPTPAAPPITQPLPAQPPQRKPPAPVEGLSPQLQEMGRQVLGEPPAEQKLSLADIALPPSSIQGQLMRLFGLMPSYERTAEAGAEGLKEGWGEKPLFSDQAESALRQAGILPKERGKPQNITQALTQGLVQPSIEALDTLFRGTSALFSAQQAVTQQAFTEAGAPRLGRDIAGFPEAFFGSPGHAISFGVPTPEMAEARGINLPRLPNLVEARAKDVIGPGGDAAYRGTVEPSAADAAEQQRAAQANAELKAAAPPTAAPRERPPLPEPTIDDHARAIAPDVLRERDELETRQTTFRRWIAELGEARQRSPEAVDAQNRIDTILGRVGGVEDRLTQSAAARLEQARADLETATTTDTGDMARVREALQKTQYRMRDIAPQVNAAYREAEARMPPAPEEEPTAAIPGEPREQPIETAAVAPAATPAERGETAAPTAAPVVPATAVAPEGKTPALPLEPSAPMQSSEAAPANFPSEISKREIDELIPANMQGNKSNLLAGAIGRLVETAAKGARRTIDAFAGMATYTHYLGARGLRKAGDIANEWDSYRYIYHKQIRDNPQAVIEATNKIIGDIKGITDGFPATATAQSGAYVKLKRDIAKYISEKAESLVQGEIPEDGGPVTMKDSPETAALYHIMQNQAFNYIPVSADSMLGGRLKLPGWGILDRTAEGKIKLWSRGTTKTTEPQQYVEPASRRLQGVDVRQGDGWKLIRDEAGAGDFVPVDTSYLLQQMSYGKRTDADADPKVWTEKVVENLLPAWDRGAKLLITNNWNDQVAAQLRDMGFNVYVAERGKGVSADVREIIATNFDAQTGEIIPRRTDVDHGAGAGAAEGRVAESAEGAAVDVHAGAPGAVAPGTAGEAGAIRGPAERPVEGSIADEAARQLVAAGRPAEEARAVGAVTQALYEIRAANLGLSPDELYAREGVQFRAGRGVEPAGAERELAQTKRGRITLAEPRHIVTLLKNADASTAIHELGHHSLENLMKDSADPRAPQPLKDDAQTVRQWLGVKEGQEIPTAAHERFARSFERYLMEGTAPSKRLADVFSKFKDWMLKVYNTVKNLHAPINDDIRQVFDRMLATPQERAVIAAEREQPKTMADLHEAEEAKTEGAHAEPTADRIEAEIDDAARARPATAELLRPREPEAGGEPAAAPGDTGAAVPAGAEPGRPGVPAEPGNVSARGEPTSPQATVVRAGAGEGGGAATRGPVELTGPVNPHAPFGDDLKAGNIRVRNVTTVEDLQNLIVDIAHENGDFMDMRGIVPDEEVDSLAAAAGVKKTEIDLKQFAQTYGVGGLASKVMAARRVLIDSAQDLKAMAIKAADAVDDAAVVAYAIARQRHIMIQGQLSSMTAEIGRSLRAFRSIAGETEARELGQMLRENTGRSLDQLKREARMLSQGGMNTPAKVSGMTRDMAKPGAGMMLEEIYKNWLISGPITHMTYSIGNTVLALYKAIPQTFAEATADVVRSAVTGAPRRVYYGEIPAQLYAMTVGQRKGWQAAWDAFKGGQTMALPGEALDSLSARERTAYEGLRAQGATMEQALAQLGIQVQASTGFTSTKAVPNVTIGGLYLPFGTAVRAPGERMVAPIHSYFRSIGYEQAIAREAYRKAMGEGLRQGSQDFINRLADLQKSPTEEMMAAARGEATEQTLMGKGGDFTQKMRAFVNFQLNLPQPIGPTRPLAFIDPFVTIQSNIMRGSLLERGPLAIFSQRLRDDMAGKNGPLAQSTTIGRVGLGTSLMVLGMGLAMEGLITPSAPADPKEAAMWRLVNGQPHALNIGHTSLDLTRLGVLGFEIGIAADLYATAHAMSTDDASKVAFDLVHSFVANFMTEGFMRGPSDLMRALDETDQYGATYARNFGSSISVPYSIGMAQVARQVDPYARQARTFMDSIKAKVPWWSEELMPQRDIWGEPVLNREYVGVYEQRLNEDPVNRKLMDINYFPSQPKRDIRGIQLTDQQYDDYSRIAGRAAKMTLDEAIRQPGFNSLPPGIQKEYVQKVIEGAREMAAGQVMRDAARGTYGGPETDIIHQAIEKKRAVLAMPATP